jgi:hypothetical protein
MQNQDVIKKFVNKKKALQEVQQSKKALELRLDTVDIFKGRILTYNY